jgi:hypothetical protein
MEETTKASPAQIEQEIAGLIPLQVIRTETVLSKLPIHNLAKKGTISINITQRNAKGETTLHWEVSPNPKYGDPRQLAYKIDTIVINRRIEEAGKPLPKSIRLGSLRDIAATLDLDGSGDSIKRIKNALFQNALTAITAKLTYQGNDGSEKNLEAAFTRYGVVFTGHKLPDGKKADAVYLILNDPYREVLNNAPFRPLNYDYLRELSPTAQRFYEVVSRRMFAALKYQHAEARLAYSEYCTCSAQQRYHDYDHFKKQMYKIHRPHLASGYVKAVRYEPAKDENGNADWIMFYTPGPKARAEYQTFTRSGRIIDSSPEIARAEVAIGPRQSKPRAVARQKRFSFTSPQASVEAEAMPALAELIKRGVAEGKAHELLAGADPEILIDQLEWGDHLVAKARSPIVNPPGFYIHLLQEKVTPPDGFETSRRRRARELAREAHDRELVREAERLEAYDAFRRAAITQHIEQHVRPEDFAALLKTNIARRRERFSDLPKETIREMAERDVRMAIAEKLNLPTFEAYCADLEAGTAATASSLA